MSNIATLSHKDFLNSPAVRRKFEEVLKGRGNQFASSLLSVVTNNSLLAKASNHSIMTAAMKAAVLDLSVEPSLGEAYVVPYNRSVKEGNRWVKIPEAQFQLGYKGLIQLAQRSGQYKNINAGVVYKSQFVSYDPLFEDLKLDFTQPADEVVGYFAAFRLLNGFEKLTYWTKEEVTRHAERFSKSVDNGPWKTDFDAMAKKTLLKQVIGTYGPKSIDMVTGIAEDNADSIVTDREVKVVTAAQVEPEGLAAILPNPAELAVDQTTGEIVEGEVVVAEMETTTDTDYSVDDVPGFGTESSKEQTALFDNLAEVTD